MTFLWPSMLFFLIGIPLIGLLYWRVQRRRQVLAAGFGQLGLGRLAQRREPGWRRHLSPLLSLLGLAILLLALARPQATVNLPRVEGTVILVFDVSGSMSATDAAPTRMEAAKAAAREFILSQPQTVQIGIVSFSGSGFAVEAPTDNTQNLLAAVNRLQPQTGTSLGQGILVALHTIAVDAGLEAPKAGATPTAAAPSSQSGGQDAQQASPDNNLLAQLPEGIYPSAVIVLLSDGENNQSIDPAQAAQAAADHGVRIDALGFGTSAGVTLEINGFSVHTALDEATLQQITQAAGGTYYYSADQQDPRAVYAKLTPQLVVKPELMEVTSIFAGVSLAILLAGAALSMLWFNRLP